MFCMLLYVFAYHNVAYHYVFLYLKITDNCIKISNKKLLLLFFYYIFKLFRITHIIHS